MDLEIEFLEHSLEDIEKLYEYLEILMAKSTRYFEKGEDSKAFQDTFDLNDHLYNAKNALENLIKKIK